AACRHVIHRPGAHPFTLDECGNAFRLEADARRFGGQRIRELRDRHPSKRLSVDMESWPRRRLGLEHQIMLRANRAHGKSQIVLADRTVSLGHERIAAVWTRGRLETPRRLLLTPRTEPWCWFSTETRCRGLLRVGHDREESRENARLGSAPCEHTSR